MTPTWGMLIGAGIVVLIWIHVALTNRSMKK